MVATAARRTASARAGAASRNPPAWLGRRPTVTSSIVTGTRAKRSQGQESLFAMDRRDAHQLSPTRKMRSGRRSVRPVVTRPCASDCKAGASDTKLVSLVSNPAAAVQPRDGVHCLAVLERLRGRHRLGHACARGTVERGVLIKPEGLRVGPRRSHFGTARAWRAVRRKTRSGVGRSNGSVRRGRPSAT